MTNTPKHRVIFFQLTAEGGLVWDHNDQAVVDRIVECDNLEEAQRLHRDAVLESGTFSVANLSVAMERFAEDDLAGYLHALNTDARLCEEHPREGTWIGSLTEDLAHWAEMGVRTPKHLADYLDGCFEREMQKAAMA